MQKLWTFKNPLSFWFVVHYIFPNKAERRIWKRVFQENKAHQIFRKTNISYSLIRTLRCAYQGVRNVCFSENLMCFVFLKHPFWDSSFCFITVDIDTLPSYYRNSKKIYIYWKGFIASLINFRTTSVNSLETQFICIGYTCINLTIWLAILFV